MVLRGLDAIRLDLNRNRQNGYLRNANDSFGSETQKSTLDETLAVNRENDQPGVRFLRGLQIEPNPW